MTNLKDKLSANVRRAKATQQPEEAQSATDRPGTDQPAAVKRPPARTAVSKPVARPRVSKPAATPAAKAAAAPAKPVGVETAAAAAKQPAAQPSSANQVKESGTALFPERIWPD